MLQTEIVKELNPLFQRAAAQGVSIFSASGDLGSDQCQDGTQQLAWPSSPYIVSVGGTGFKMAADGVTIQDEVAWNGSGGGFSMMYDRPDWQMFGVPSEFTTRGEP